MPRSAMAYILKPDASSAFGAQMPQHATAKMTIAGVNLKQIA